jgi:uncharacterized membrane protein YkvI
VINAFKHTVNLSKHAKNSLRIDKMITKRSLFQRIILPGLIFQSTMVGGGYATGREIVEFFLHLGPLNGLFAMLLATCAISLVCAVAFEFARKFALYNYKAFFQKLLGSGWILFEIAYVALVLLVVSVLGAASGELFFNSFNLAPLWGTSILMVSITLFVYLGSSVIEKFLSYWSVILYISYAALIIWTISMFGDDIKANFLLESTPTLPSQIFKAGWTYAGYNIVVFTAVLFSMRHIFNRRDAIVAGILCGPLSMLPGIFLFLAMVAHYPQVINENLPISYLLSALQAPVFFAVLQVVIFGTFIETGTAILHSVNERVGDSFAQKEKAMPRYIRPLVSMSILIFAIFMANKVGIVELISKGYRYSTYLFVFIVIIPLLTRGVMMLRKSKKLESNTGVLISNNELNVSAKHE